MTLSIGTRSYLTVGLGGCGLHVLTAGWGGRQALFVALALTAPLVALTVLRQTVTRPQPAWWVLLGGVGLAAIGEVLDHVVVTLQVWPDSDTEIELVFLTAYFIELSGVAAMLRCHSASSHRFGWFDTAAIGVMVATVMWTTMYEAIFGADSTPLHWLVSFGGAVFGVALIVVTLRLLLVTRESRTSAALLFVAFVCQFTADTVAATSPSYATGDATDTLWAIAYVLLGAALLSRTRPSPPRQPASRLAHLEISHTLILQTAVMVILAGMIVLQVAGHVPTVMLIVWATAWLTILLITRVRIFGLVKMIGEATACDQRTRLSAMVGTSREVIGLADPDWTLRYLTPSMSRLIGVPSEAFIGQRFDSALMHHFDGVDDLGHRTAMLQTGEHASWECTVQPVGDRDSNRTVTLTVTNQIDTPELHGWVITVHDITDAARHAEELRYQSLHDILTGLPNRALLFDRIQHCLERRSRRTTAMIAIVLVDLDDFKSVNDSLGHAIGDELLRRVATRLHRSVRQGDTVARLGGDEFAILIEDTDEAGAMTIAHNALASLDPPIRIGSIELTVQASAGVVGRTDSTNAVEMLRRADIAMYASKRDGKGTATLFRDEMRLVADQQFETRTDLARSLERNEFFLEFQPIVDTRNLSITGVEALIRWHHPVRGPVSPSEFIPIAEQTGQIREIGAWVLRTACAEAAAWPAIGSNSYISVNVSAPQLKDPHFVAIVTETLRATELDPRRLMLEITESMLVEDSAHARCVLTQLRQHGIRIAIDDFGTGYSSLAYLRALCVDVVKIDRAFVREVNHNPDHQALTRTILALADGLDMTAIAEGVETADELHELSRLGCAYAQGFLFARPVTNERLHAVLQSSVDLKQPTPQPTH